jgi:ABC-type transport system involved in multi-copper enzyme maturation permease subunit
MIEIITKEIRENLATSRFSVLTGLMFILMAISVFVSYGDFHQRMENYNILRPAPTEQNKIILPPEPLSIFAKGLDANAGRLYTISTIGIEVESNQESINRLFALFTVPDFLFVIKVVLALIAILFSFDAVSGEREQGTLKLILTGRVSRISIVLGKFAGRFLLVFAPFLVFSLMSAIIVSLLPDVTAGTEFRERFLLILIASGLYVAAFTAIGVLMSSLVPRSATALALGIAAWVLLVFVIPQLGAATARTIRDVPPGDRIEMESRLASIQSIYEELQAAKANPGQGERSRISKRIREASGHLFDVYRPKLNGLIDLTRDLVRASPSGALGLFVTEMTNTGIGRDLDLKDAIRLFIDRNLDRLAGLVNEPAEQFQLRSPTPGEQLAGTALADAVLLLLAPLVFITCAVGAFMRYDSR